MIDLKDFVIGKTKNIKKGHTCGGCYFTGDDKDCDLKGFDCHLEHPAIYVKSLKKIFEKL